MAYYTNDFTKAQFEVLMFIKTFINDNCYPPSVREIAKGLGKNSPATIQSHLDNLKQKGFIKMQENKSRTIQLL